jgi:hypothetical protein
MNTQEHAYYGDGHDVTYSDTLIEPSNSLKWFANVAGAVASLALVAGVGTWGYKLMIRDVSGIPIVRAMEGDMRVRPDDPGGDLAQHQGLAVNEVAAAGSAAAPPDRLVLAPQPVRLTEEDMPMDDEAVAIVQQAIADQARAENEPEAVAEAAPAEAEDDTAARIASATQSGSVDDLVAALTEGMTPMENDSDPAGPEVVVQAALELPSDPVVLDAPGVRTSMRPKLRPAAFPAQVVPASLTVETSAAAAPVDPENLPAGTRLVQLGAYESIDVAQVEWAKFSARFQDLMVGKRQVVQKASSGGRSFYRLRAMGFEDLSEARRFCSALVAEGADCIPVVTR